MSGYPTPESDEINSTRTILLVGAGLLLLTGTTIALAHVDLHGWNPVAGLGIACTKALLIALFFMHLWRSAGMTRLVGVAALLWLTLLLVGTTDDYLTRAWLPLPGK
ncbi:MAG: cytochrome C oxidase subunit IV family protein [Chloroflexota bacterium]|nr:cytochrome C oxidase subunit IV family protein [Chloroflexota bacterium]